MKSKRALMKTFLQRNKGGQDVPAEGELQDLGFGSIVAQQSRRRLINRDGTFNVRREGLSFWESFSLYHALLNMTWPHFLLSVAGFYLVVNLVFGIAYWFLGAGVLTGQFHEGNAFLHSFFFSVQTFSTVGYGGTLPIGLFANILVTIESIAGLVSVALATGIVFARFSRPKANIVFSRFAVVAPYGGGTAFEFRITNARNNQLVEMEAQVLLSRFETEGGKKVRRFHTLTLERSKVTFFPLSWTVVHPIDKESPLNGETPQSLLESDAEFLVLLKGIDDTFSQGIHQRSSYKFSEVVWDAKFTSIYTASGPGKPISIDIGKLHDVEPVRPAVERSS